jgi:hypothetical protein
MADPQNKSVVQCRMISPQFVVPDVVAAAEYYRDVLGFLIRGYFLDPPIYAIVARDSIKIHFGKALALPPRLTSNGAREASAFDWLLGWI